MAQQRRTAPCGHPYTSTDCYHVMYDLNSYSQTVMDGVFDFSDMTPEQSGPGLVAFMRCAPSQLQSLPHRQVPAFSLRRIPIPQAIRTLRTRVHARDQRRQLGTTTETITWHLIVRRQGGAGHDHISHHSPGSTFPLVCAPTNWMCIPSLLHPAWRYFKTMCHPGHSCT